MLNKSTLMGRLTADPELKKTGQGTSVCSFTLACDRDFKNQDGEREPDWIDCVAWRGTAEFISRYFTKGRMMVVDGRLQTRTYEDKQGNKRKVTEVVVDNAYFGDSKQTDGAHAEPTAAPAGFAPAPASAPVSDEDLPF